MHLLGYELILRMLDCLHFKHLKKFLLDSILPGVPMGTNPDACDTSLKSKVSSPISHEPFLGSG